MQIRLVVEIDAPPDTVWAILDDPANLPKWIPEVVETSFPHGQDRAKPVGTRFRQKIKEGGRIKEYEGLITRHEPKQRLGIRLGDRSFAMDVGYHVMADRGGTRLEYELAAELKSLFAKLMGFLARPLSLRIATRQLAALKKLAELTAGRRAEGS